MFITAEELKKIAGLAKLSLENENTDALLADMADIIGIASSINDADISRLNCSGDNEAAELRDDIVMPSLPVEAVLSNAANKQGDFFAAPPITR